jgi:PIF1-like helicase
MFIFRFFAPFKNKHHVVYPLWQGLGSYSISPRTHTKKRGEVLGHVTLDENKSLHRIQSYSPNFRVFHGKNGIAENTFDIRKFSTGTDEKDRSLICLSDAARKIDEWLEFAKEKVSVLRKSCGMARLELTFHSKNLDYDIFDTGVDTLIRTFHESTKVYSASLIANLAEISLHSFEGISRGLFYWFGPNSNTSEPISWNVFSEVWNYLSHFARHFFDGRRSYLTDKIYSPRLGYIFSRHFINPSWTGIREAMNLICGGDNLEKLRRAWFSKSKMIDSYDHSIATNLTSSVVNLDNNIGVKVSALLELLNVHSRSDRRHINDAVSCSHCQTICSTINSKKDAWALHPCDWNNLMNSSSSSTKRNIDLRTDEFDQYLKKVTKLLSPSQLESLVSIMGTNQNCFLTGVAGSGKSFLLKVFYPMMIRIYGFAGICITGPTNIAASNVFGQTLHKLLGLIVNRSTDAMIYEQNIEKFERLLKDHVDILNSRNPVVIQNLILCQVLIIDEAGMIDEAVLNFIDKLLREVKGCPEKDFGGVRIILIGDVMQLEPFQPEGYKKFTNLFFQHNTFKNFFVAYLRSNMRQQDDAPFLDALNKIRIGDGSAAIYLSEFVSILNNTSKSTLTLARLKKDQPIYNVDKMKSRIDYYGLQRSRIQLDARYANEEYDEEIKIINNRILNAKDTGYTDLIVCHDNVENKQYTYLKNANQKEEKFQCASVDSFISPYSKQPVLTWLVETKNQIEKKLIPLLVIYKGMSCRVTYQTDNRYVCTNALVVIEDIIVSGGKVTHIDIITCEKNMKARIIPVKISETFTYLSVTYEFSRSQFGVVDSAGLVPWNLQCLTISGNLFYDNSRSSNNKHSTKGILYTIISRVKRKEQLSYLHLITSEEITYGVNTKAKTFDEKYRLQDGVIFDIIF